ncbi:hypothetical protein N3K63_04355 [Microbacterium sp. W1N]|uniref:hypothetical protein n=1 Tax=Microbacterium festucae TaxID=2977531 RepID=UPI0021BF165E|nr:hypothetical protein [Microbacterium festucae]MCT9819514.1 hypothetical protein [Microbacterium festucae]
MSLAQRRRRKALLSWIPITLVALICAGFVVGAIAMQNSWWTESDPAASDDQQTADGMSRFDQAGIDYFTRQGIVRVKVLDDAATATALGLPADGSQDFSPLTPVTVIVLAPDGAFAHELVASFTVDTQDDRVTAVRLLLDGSGTWAGASAQLRAMASDWGWTDDQLTALTDDVGEKVRSGAGVSTVTLPAVPVKGALVSAEVQVDTSSGVALTLVVADPAAG